MDHRVPLQEIFATSIGGNVTLTIPVIANPTPTFTWFKFRNWTTVKITGGSKTTTDVSAVGNLTLTDVQKENLGTYQVVVSNGDHDKDLVASLELVDEGVLLLV